MKRVIEGKTYDTATATRICDVPCSTNNPGDFDWHDTTLYRSPKGTYFVSGEGGARSMWSKTTGTNSWSGGSGLRVLDPMEAQEIAEEAGLDADDMEAAGFQVEAG